MKPACGWHRVAPSMDDPPRNSTPTNSPPQLARTRLPPLPAGELMFGLSHPQVLKAVRKLPGAQRCEGYLEWPEGQQPVAVPLVGEGRRRSLAYCLSEQRAGATLSLVGLIQCFAACRPCSNRTAGPTVASTLL